MADSNPDVETPQIQAKNQPMQSPPPSPPITSATESDLKLPKKREREVSLEPATPKADFVDIDAGRQEGKERRTPAKKNRIQLDATEEEEDAVSGSRASSRSPPLSTSPPHEVKIRQISQGVEDLTWRNGMKKIIFEDDTPQAVEEADSNPMRDMNDQRPADVAADENAKAAPDDAPDSSTLAVPDDEANDVVEVGDDPVSQAPPPQPEDDPEIGDKEKGIKRKYAARLTSGDILTSSRIAEQLKRPRDDPGEDDNPREAKRPSPPPSPEPKPVQAASPTPKLTGFMAYAMTNSPLGAVKGRNIFSPLNKTSPASPLLSSSTSSFPGVNFGEGESSTTVEKTDASKESEATPKLSGFESYMSTSSPFASVARSKSPPLGSRFGGANRSPTRRTKPSSFNAFSSYASAGVQGFHVPKRARASSPSGGSSRSSLERPSVFGTTSFNGAGDSGGEEEEEEDDRSVSFGEKLRAGRDEEEEAVSDEEKGKYNLTEQDVITGEEDEETLYQVRGKLFSLSSQNQWKERGTGLLKLNVRRYDYTGARLVMRKDAVYNLLLNATLFKGMRCFLAQDPRYLRFSVIENGVTVHYNLRVASAKVASELLEEINSNIPTST